jgi:acylphosphatase
MRKAYKIKVTGRVQGVGYRYFASKEAGYLGISGYVKNLPNGDVELFAEGEDSQMNRFIEILKDGPAFGRVEDVLLDEQPANNDYSDFSVEY